MTGRPRPLRHVSAGRPLTVTGRAGPLYSQRWLKARATRRDLTEYESWRAKGFMVYWTQRISAAVVTGDARRALNALAAKATELATAPG